MSEQNLTILIGNGFNHALRNALPEDARIDLDYRSITNKMVEILDSTSKVVAKNVLNSAIESEHFDVEKTLNLLSQIPHLCNVFRTSGLGQAAESQLLLFEEQSKQAYDDISQCFLEAIENLHPQYNSIFSCIDPKIVINNLLRFDKIFTINFDLILYWVINSEGFEHTLTSRFKDKFSTHLGDHALVFNQKSEIINEWNYIYLHGAFHLLNSMGTGEVLKIKRTENIGLLETYNKLKKSDNFEPLIVFGKTSNEKRSIIAGSGYLSKAFRELQRTNGKLIVYGCEPCSTDPGFNDAHLWEAILLSDVRDLCIGIVNDKDEEKIKTFIKSRCSKDINVTCFNASTVNIWTDQNFLDMICR